MTAALLYLLGGILTAEVNLANARATGALCSRRNYVAIMVLWPFAVAYVLYLRYVLWR